MGFFQGTLHKCLEVSQNCCFVNKREVGWQNVFLRKLNSVFFTENNAGDSTIKNKLNKCNRIYLHIYSCRLMSQICLNSAFCVDSKFTERGHF